MPDPKKKPIIVNSKNDPRYRAYQDSLSLYNYGKTIPNKFPNEKPISKKDFIKKNNIEKTFKYYDIKGDEFEKDSKSKKNKPLKNYYKEKGISPNYKENVEKAKQEIINMSFEPYFNDKKLYTDGKYRGSKQYINDKDYSQIEYDPVSGTSVQRIYLDGKLQKESGVVSSNKIKPIGVTYSAYDNPLVYNMIQRNNEKVENKTFSLHISPYYKKPTTPVIVNKGKYNPNDPRLLDLQKRLENTLLKPQQPVIVQNNKKYNSLKTNNSDLYNTKLTNGDVPRYADGTPVYVKKTKQPVVVQDIRKPNTTIGKQVKEEGNKGMVFNETIQKKPLTTINNNLTSIGLQTISSSPKANIKIRPQARIPKYFKVTDKVNQNFGSSQTDYEWYPENGPLKEIAPEPYNSRTMIPQYAYGGNLNNKNMQNNNLTRFDEGGLHHQNPLGGIPIGGNNTVEEGETKMKNYVYSNRLSIDENMTKEMNLPSYIKGKTFASASKAIDDKFKDRNDKHSLETKNTFLERLKQAQETLKQQEQLKAEQIAQSMQSNQQQIPDMMNGEIPEGMEEFTEQNQMFDGGFEQGELGNLTGGGSGISGSGILGAGMGALSLGNLSQGIGATPNKNATALNGALTGAQAGMAFGPVGAGVGALVGLGAGILGGNKAQREQARFAKKQAISYNNAVSEQYALGGNLEEDPLNPLFKPTNTIPQVGSGKPSDFLGYTINQPRVLPRAPLADDLIKPTTKEQIQAYQKAKGLVPDGIFGKKSNAQFELDKKNWTPEIPDISMLKSTEQPFVEPTGVLAGMEKYYQDGLKSKSDKEDVNFKNIANQALRLSPILSNFSQLKGMKKPNPVSYIPLRNTFKYDPVDEVRQEKLISEEGNKQLSAINQSGASQGAMRNAITSVGLNTTKARSNAAMETEAQNRAQRLSFQQSQLGVNQHNNQLQNKAIDETRMDQGNYDTQRSKFIGQIGSDLGEIGKENTFKKQAEKMTGYSWMGDYVNSNPNYKAQFDAIDKDPSLNDVSKYAKKQALMQQIFNGMTPEELKIAENNSKNLSSYGLAYGGYLKMNKIGKK
jgi:hypothetical protein